MWYCPAQKQTRETEEEAFAEEVENLIRLRFSSPDSMHNFDCVLFLKKKFTDLIIADDS